MMATLSRAVLGHHCELKKPNTNKIRTENNDYADVDGKDWIGCDGCHRWVHIECEALYDN